MASRTCSAGLAILAAACVCGDVVPLQSQNRPDDSAVTVRGRVLNAVTNEPVARAVVNLQGRNTATYTDDRGQFEFNIEHGSNPGNGGVVTRLGGRFIAVRKLGFLQNEQLPATVTTPGKDSSELIIYLLPEAKIVGHVDVPGSEGDVRIECQLLRKEINDGREIWSPQRTFRSWVDGEFRFYGLKPGTYKLITHEQMDRESPGIPGAQLYGYPPVYYQNTTDISLATPILVKAGETARVNLTVARKEYFPVRIDVQNMPAGRGMNLSVYPMGHRGPGWSLGYDQGDGVIQGTLPNGNYTVEASTPGEGELSGILNFAVKGNSPDAGTLTLIPDANIGVRVREDFQSMPSNFGSMEGSPGNSQPGLRRYANVNVNLFPVDEFNQFPRSASSRASAGSPGQELTIPDVRPGHYRVEVHAGSGYVASIQSGGNDLSHQPLVVGLGGEVAPIEIVLRDDGAQVSGTLEEQTAPGTNAANELSSRRFVYLLPIEGGRTLQVPAWQGTFNLNQVPPGNYLVVAFEQPQQDLPSGPGEPMQRLLEKGQFIRVGAGQNLSLRVKVIESESQ